MAFGDILKKAAQDKGLTSKAAADEVGVKLTQWNAWCDGTELPNRSMLFLIQNNLEFPKETHEALKNSLSAPISASADTQTDAVPKRPRGRPRNVEASKPVQTPPTEPPFEPDATIKPASALDRAVSEKLAEIHQSKAWLAKQMNLSEDRLSAYLEHGIKQPAVAEKMANLLGMKPDTILGFRGSKKTSGPAAEKWHEVFKPHSPEAKLIISGKCVFDRITQGLALNKELSEQIISAVISEDKLHVEMPAFMKDALGDENALLWNVGMKALAEMHEDPFLDLRNQDLSRKNLEGFDLSNSDLRGAKWPAQDRHMKGMKLNSSVLHDGKPNAINPDYARLPRAVLDIIGQQGKSR